MSLNTSHAGGGVLIYSGERILIYCDGVEMSFDMSCHMPHFKGTKKGRVYLTTHRVIFNSKSLKDTLQSFSMPFHCLKEVDLEQPVFGANYIKGKVLAEAGGNWEGNGKFKMWFNSGGAIEFGRALLEAGRRASRNAPRGPPPYSPPTANYYQAPPPAYTPPQGQAYNFVPYQTFPTAPPADGVYMYEAPPPYPGIDPNMQPYPPPPQTNGYPQGVNGYPQGANGYPQGANGYPQGAGGFPQQMNPAAEAKAAEAAGSAYYAPNDPHNVYMPQPYPGTGQPPPYSEATKKDQ